jgi:hypothetical protein
MADGCRRIPWRRFVNRETCLFKNQNLISATKLFFEELEKDFTKTELRNCEKCKLRYDRTTSIRLHYCLQDMYAALAEIREILRT